MICLLGTISTWLYAYSHAVPALITTGVWLTGKRQLVFQHGHQCHIAHCQELSGILAGYIMLAEDVLLCSWDRDIVPRELNSVQRGCGRSTAEGSCYGRVRLIPACGSGSGNGYRYTITPSKACSLTAMAAVVAALHTSDCWSA